MCILPRGYSEATPRLPRGYLYGPRKSAHSARTHRARVPTVHTVHAHSTHSAHTRSLVELRPDHIDPLSADPLTAGRRLDRLPRAPTRPAIRQRGSMGADEAAVHRFEPRFPPTSSASSPPTTRPSRAPSRPWPCPCSRRFGRAPAVSPADAPSPAGSPSRCRAW